MDGFFARWAMSRWRGYRLRKRMHRIIQVLMRAREAGPELFRYVEALRKGGRWIMDRWRALP